MIDCHFHIWDIKKSYYTWLTPELNELYHTFSIQDYRNTIAPLGIRSAIVVQAADNIKETVHLLEISSTSPMIKGVIGWIDFESKTAVEDLKNLAKNKYFKGIRPMLQDIEDVTWIGNPEFRKIFETLVTKDLLFEALVKQEHLPSIIHIAKQYPDLQIVINHGAKPMIDGKLDNDKFQEWKRLIKDISSHKNVVCKLSGLVTECTREHTKEYILPYVKVLIESFSPKRVVWGSDWPVVKLKCSYAEWLILSRELLNFLSTNEQKNIFENNAKNIYSIGKEYIRRKTK